MAVQNKQIVYPFKAAGDLSTKQFYFVKLSAAHTVDVCSGATDKPIGVLQNKPSAAGQEAEVCVVGWTKVSSNGSVSAGDLIGTSGDGQGDTKAAGTDTTEYICGQAITAGTTAGDVFEAIIDCASIGRGA